MHFTEDLNLIATFLARRDIQCLTAASAGKVDVIVLLGSSVLETLDAATEAYSNGLSDKILVSGGIGHSTPNLWQKVGERDRPEAEILAEILTKQFGIPTRAILKETTSTNCGANARESKRTLQNEGINPKRLLLIQDPTMQRRTHASFQRAWREDSPPEFISFAPFVPRTSCGQNGQIEVTPPAWPPERFIDLLLSEIPKLLDSPEGYGPQGRDFIEHVHVPKEILEAHARISHLRNKLLTRTI